MSNNLQCPLFGQMLSAICQPPDIGPEGLSIIFPEVPSLTSDRIEGLMKGQVCPTLEECCAIGSVVGLSPERGMALITPYTGEALLEGYIDATFKRVHHELSRAAKDLQTQGKAHERSLGTGLRSRFRRALPR